MMSFANTLYIERVAEFSWRSSKPSFLPVASVPSSMLAPFHRFCRSLTGVSFTKSRMNLFRLNERIDRGPAISKCVPKDAPSVC